MKRILSLLLACVFALSLTACGEKEKTNSSSKSDVASNSSKTEASSENSDIKNVEGNATLSNIGEFIELCDYENYEIDWSNGTAKEILDSYVVNITDRPIKEGDIANIDYVGKKDGVAFDGGTASGYDLTIGSHSFIDGFEEGLVGVSVGETVDLNLTFPEQYHSADLAGAEVVFTVKVNSIKGVSDKEEDIEKAKEICAFDAILLYAAGNSKYKALPKGDLEIYKAQYVGNYGEEVGMQYAEETVKQLLAIFAIAKNEGVEISEKERNEKEKILTENNNVTIEEIEKIRGTNYVDLMILLDKVPEALKDKA